MADEKLLEFRRTIFFDVSLQEKLRAVADRQKFIHLTVELGRERGFEFTADEVENSLREGRRVWLERWLG